MPTRLPPGSAPSADELSHAERVVVHLVEDPRQNLPLMRWSAIDIHFLDGEPISPSTVGRIERG